MRKGRMIAENEKKKSEDNLSKGLKIVNIHKEKVEKEREERKHSVNKNKEGYNKIRPFVLALITSLILIFVLLFMYFGPMIGISINRNSGISEERKIDIVSTDADIYESYCSDFLIYSNQKIITYNSRGRKNWEYELTSQFTPNIYIKGKYMAVTNNSNGKIYLFENKKEILNTKIDGEINEMFIDDNGYYAVEYYTNGYKKVLGVFSKNGKNLYNAYISSDPVVDVRILNNSKEVLIIQTNTSSFSVGMSISVINTAKEGELKKITTLDNNFMYNLTIQGRNIIMLLDDKIVKCNIDTSEVSTIYSFDLNQLMYISLANNYYSAISKELNEKNLSTYSITSNRFDNTRISFSDILDSPKFIKNVSVFNYLVYQDKLQVINKWGIEVKNIDLDFPPKDVIIFNNGKSVALVYTNRVYIVNL